MGFMIVPAGWLAGASRGTGLALCHGQLPVIESRTVEAYFAGSSSQTKWSASMITRRLAGSRWSRNSALASGTTRSPAGTSAAS